jgi:hypothetical protein
VQTTKTEACSTEEKRESLATRKATLQPVDLFIDGSRSRTPCVALASPRPAPRLSGLALSRNQTGLSRSEHLTIRLNGAAEGRGKKMKEKQ